MKQRLAYIDTAKAAGIIMICLGHFLPASTMPKVAIYSFHVPLFFFIAGLLNARPIPSFRQYLQRERALAVRTLIPYALWFVFSLSYNLLRNSLNVAETVRCFFFLEGQMIWNTPLWFLPCYFMMVSVFRLLCMLTRGNRGWLLLFCAAAFVCAVLIDKLDVAFTFLGLNKGVHMLGYILLGCLCSDLVRKEAANRGHACLWLLAFGGILLTSAVINHQNNLSPFQTDYNEILLFIPFACVLCVSFLISCSLIPENDTVSLLAKNSCFIMCSHYFPWLIAGMFIRPLTILSGSVCTLLLTGAYICFLTLCDRNLRAPKLRRLLSYAGLQFDP